MIKISDIRYAFLSLLLLLASCSEHEFQGDEVMLVQSDSMEILFGTTNEPLTRVARNLETYEGTMLVYAAKRTPNNDTYTRALNRYAIWNTSNDPAEAGNWEYVAAKDEKKTVIKNGKAGTADNFTVPQDQVQKFWDYKAPHYLFWAAAPYRDYNNDKSQGGAIEMNISTTTGSTYNTVTSLNLYDVEGHLTANNTTTPPSYYKYYIANPVRVEKEAYGTLTVNNPITFHFDELHAKVRVAFYETIPHYKIIGIKFYNNAASPVASNNITFNRSIESFVGGKSGKDRQYANIEFDNTDLTYTYSYTNCLAQSWIQFGKLDLSATSPMADGDIAYMPSWGTDGDMASDFYFTVLPTHSSLQSSTAPITLKVDFTIKADDVTGEEIEVRGVTATVPNEFSTWKPNHAYSYVFKITREALDLKKIEFDAEASSISDSSTEHTEVLSDE